MKENDLQDIQDQIDSLSSKLSSEISSLSSSLSSQISSVTTTLVPKYSSRYSISSGFTTPSIGWIQWLSTSNDKSSSTLTIGGTQAGYHSQYKYGDPHQILYLAAKGVTVKWTGKSSAYFVPCYS